MLRSPRFLGWSLASGAVALPLVLACQCGDPSTPPPPRPCGSASTLTAVDEIAVGYHGEGSTDFVPSAPGGIVAQEYGGQGIEMARFQIGLRTTESAACVPLVISGAYSLDQGVGLTRSGDWLVTEDLYVVQPSRSGVTLHAEAAGRSVEGTWSVVSLYGVDAATPDGGPGDGG